MTCLKTNYLLILLLFSTLVNPTFAQRKKAKQPKVNPLEVVRNIMRTGDYPQAQDYIAKEQWKKEARERSERLKNHE